MSLQECRSYGATRMPLLRGYKNVAPPELQECRYNNAATRMSLLRSYRNAAPPELKGSNLIALQECRPAGAKMQQRDVIRISKFFAVMPVSFPKPMHSLLKSPHQLLLIR